MGSLPSSRLAKMLQDKAEALKRRRQAAETAAQQAERHAELLRSVGLKLPESETREAALKESLKRTDWDGAEAAARNLLAYLESTGGPALAARRGELTQRVARLASGRFPVAEDVPPRLAESEALQSEGKWIQSLEKVLSVQEAVVASQAKDVDSLEAQIRALGTWSEASPAAEKNAIEQLKPVLDGLRAGKTDDPAPEIQRTVEAEFPQVSTRWAKARDEAKGILDAARELGVQCQSLETELERDRVAFVLDAPSSTERLSAEVGRVVDAVRERVGQTVEGYRSLLGSLRASGIDPTASLTKLEEVAGPIPSLPAAELPGALTAARRIVEEPVVGLVAELLDEVRPRLVEVRQLGRNATEVFNAMNRAREALRLRIYGEAVAASQEALERVAALTSDLDSARDEVQLLDDLLNRLGGAGFPASEFRAALESIHAKLDKIELPAAQAELKSVLQRVGSGAVAHFQGQLSELERLGQQATEMGFTPADFGTHLMAAGKLLEEGELADAASACARLMVEVRTAAQPFFANRLDEIGRGLSEIPDGALVDPVRRLLADADVTLRVKEDLKGALETLRKAEREFSVVSAQHASSLVDGLEEEIRVLEEMGGSGEELQRQIDEVQQIFNMGDFVKAFRAAQEIRNRAHTQQLLRSEEAISHAKLALVELTKMGLDPSALRASLEAAQGSAREGLYPESYRAAQKALDAALKLKTTAQAILDRIREVTDLWEVLKKAGVQVQPYSDQIALARTACETLDFDRARSAVEALHGELDREQARFEAKQHLRTSELLIEDASRLGLPVEKLPARVAEIRHALESGPAREGWTQARALETELVGLLRPVLEENLRSLERDVEIARTIPLDVDHAVETLGEIRQRLSAPVPLGVAELLDAARARFFETKGFLEHAERATKRAREELNRAELVRVDVKPFRSRLDRVERHLSEKDFSRVIEQASHLERELTQATHQQVAKTLATFQGMLTKARSEHAPTALAENLLEQARHTLDAGQPIEALTLAARSESELERAELQLRIAQASLETIDHRVAAKLRTGLNAPTAVATLEEARAAFTAHEYPKVLERSLAASDALSQAVELERRAREALDSAERGVREAGEMNADLHDVLPILEQTRVYLRGGEYDRAIRQALESGDGARWAIERLYSGPLAELQELAEFVHSTGTEAEAAAVRTGRQEAEAAVKVRDWKRATATLAHTKERAYAALDRAVQAAERSLNELYTSLPSVSETELTRRRALAERILAERTQKSYRAALDLLREEESRAREQARADIARRLGELKDRLWIGEKLGLDTTPVMEVFSEAKLALEAGKLDPVIGLLDRGGKILDGIVGKRLHEKVGELETELLFARDGLHVTLGPVPEKMEKAKELLQGGAPVDAGKLVLEAEEELNRRKALNRELTNLHFLVDAALGRAVERRLDTSEARKLLDESIRLRANDYPPALEKARDALKILQEQLQRTEPEGLPSGMRSTSTDARA